jgi:surface protein
VVDNTSKSMITDYAINLTSGSGRTYFTPPGESSAVPFNNIVTTLVTDMSSMFKNAYTFNEPIHSWDTSNVTNMLIMFLSASFNQPIGSWNTSKVTDMGGMFSYTIFNQPIVNWNTSNVTNMNSMFYSASYFNQPIGTWNTSKVTNMNYMFQNAYAFNQNISTWNVVKVTPKPPITFSTGPPLSVENSPKWV